MKKRGIRAGWFAALLVFALVLGLAGPVSASEEDYMDFKSMGFSFRLTDALKSEKRRGFLSLSGGEELGYASGIYNIDLLYVGMDMDEYKEIASKTELTQEEQTKLQDAVWYLFRVFCVSEGRDFSAACTLLQEDYGIGLNEEYAEEIAKAGDYTFYRYNEPTAEYREKIEPEFAEEYTALLKESDVMLEDARYTEPISPYAEYIGKPFLFDTEDMDGNPVNSQELFSQHEITMVNFWTSWCPHCVEEMGEIEKINARLEEKDCAIIGMLCDGYTEGAKETAEKILEDTGATFLQLMPPDNLNSLFSVTAYPTSIFVNRNGEMIGEPIIGAQYWIYEDAVLSLLEN